MHVSVNDDGLLLGGERVTNGGGSGKDESLLADVRSMLDHIGDHLVDKGGLASRDEECTSETLEDCNSLARWFLMSQEK